MSALPLAIGFGIASGVTPQEGLWTGIIASIAVAPGRTFKADSDVVRIWECQLAPKKQARFVARIRKAINKK